MVSKLTVWYLFHIPWITHFLYTSLKRKNQIYLQLCEISNSSSWCNILKKYTSNFSNFSNTCSIRHTKNFRKNKNPPKVWLSWGIFVFMINYLSRVERGGGTRYARVNKKFMKWIYEKNREWQVYFRCQSIVRKFLTFFKAWLILRTSFRCNQIDFSSSLSFFISL